MVRRSLEVPEAWRMPAVPAAVGMLALGEAVAAGEQLETAQRELADWAVLLGMVRRVPRAMVVPMWIVQKKGQRAGLGKSVMRANALMDAFLRTDPERVAITDTALQFLNATGVALQIAPNQHLFRVCRAGAGGVMRTDRAKQEHRSLREPTTRVCARRRERLCVGGGTTVGSSERAPITMILSHRKFGFCRVSSTFLLARSIRVLWYRLESHCAGVRIPAGRLAITVPPRGLHRHLHYRLLPRRFRDSRSLFPGFGLVGGTHVPRSGGRMAG